VSAMRPMLSLVCSKASGKTPSHTPCDRIPSHLSITTYYHHALSLRGADNPSSRYPSLSHNTPRSNSIEERQAMRYMDPQEGAQRD
jgi:hypothetical protein